MECSCNTQFNDPNTVSVTTPDGQTVPYQRPTLEQLHQDWPLDPQARAPIIAGLAAMAQRGATKTRRTRDREKKEITVTHHVRPRESLRAMRIINAIGRLSLRQQRRD